MPAKSRSQQRLFGAVHSCKKEGKCASTEIEKIANSISDKDAEDFASTKHKGLPEKKKKKKLKSFKEFVEQQNINAATRQMANISMGNDSQDLQKKAQQAGIPTGKYYNVLSKFLHEIEEKLNLSNQQSGEEANKWHPEAFQLLDNILRQAVGGKKQWSIKQQISNIKKQGKKNKQNSKWQNPQQQNTQQQMPQWQNPQQQTPQWQNNFNGGPTPLNKIG